MRSGRQFAEQEAGAKHNVETRCSKIAHATTDRTRMIDRTRVMMPTCAIFEQRVSTLRLAPAVGSTPCRPDLAGSQRTNNSKPAASRQAGSKARQGGEPATGGHTEADKACKQADKHAGNGPQAARDVWPTARAHHHSANTLAHTSILKALVFWVRF